MAANLLPADSAPMVEMNTTPLIDVMLVLLIMFIITIPIQTHAVKTDLPNGPAGTVVDTLRNRLTIDAGGVTRWNGSAVNRATLRAYLERSMQLPSEPELQFQPDAEARYEAVDQVMAEIKRAGVTRMGFVGNEKYQLY
ncbi:ExbD/TolR family protein [Flavisphingomonas formosensis]|uniref:ExbD/TolR family protein n=1 Tax=Flavisphingomonas formosensis TaxID=861534 RepID=UPI0012FA64C6|nr:biopolymer transporter ExbD [Sphingomonas formosensis]